MATSVAKETTENLRTLPGDDARQIMWRYSDRYDLQMLVQSVRAVARGPVARLVAAGGRNSHEWTKEKDALLAVYDEAGITGVFMDPDQGGFIAGPKNLAMSLVAFELAWVDAGAATGSLASCLALSPIHERGTKEQRDRYMSLAAPPKPGENRKPWRGAFCLTEPIPYVGVDTGVLAGKLRVAEWADDKEPILQVEKRGRFITNMGFANFVTAAVDSADERIKGSCMVILEEGDPGVFDRGTPTKKMVHQLSSTSDPVFNLRVPASRIIGGYTVKEGVIIPNYDHSQVIEAVFGHTRVTVGVMTSAKLLSAVEPIIRYQRGRFRGSEMAKPGSLRYELGLQQREDVIHRLVDIWATGEASTSLAFAAARLFDELDPLEQKKNEILAAQGVKGGRAELAFFKGQVKNALELLDLEAKPEGARDEARLSALREDVLVQFALKDATVGVLCPAAKLWNTGHGANVMREAVSLVGGYGITEDCPGFLGQKWMDAQLEATYEGPEAVQRRNLGLTMTQELFLAQMRAWIADLRRLDARWPGTGACTLANAMSLWLWTLEHLQKNTDADGGKLYSSSRHGVTFPLADALCWLLAAHCQILDLVELEAKGPQSPSLSEGLAGLVNFMSDLCHVQSARAAGEVGRICAELIYGYNRHPVLDAKGMAACYEEDELNALRTLIPQIGGAAGGVAVAGKDGSKGGRYAAGKELQQFGLLRMRLDACLTGARLAKDRAAEAVSKVMIPEALDYPV